jgi:acyl carrier protein
MVPALFVPLEALPLSPNGKVDRRTLPAPGSAGLASDRAHVPPRSALEETLAEIWTGVLGIERVGVHDNFFEIGGHSLKATQVVAKLRRELQVDLPVRTLFEAPTVARLSVAVVRQAVEQADEEELSQILSRPPDPGPVDLLRYEATGGRRTR